MMPTRTRWPKRFSQGSRNTSPRIPPGQVDAGETGAEPSSGRRHQPRSASWGGHRDRPGTPPLRETLSGFWSRRIDEANRLVYCVDGDDLVIIACRYHYENWADRATVVSFLACPGLPQEHAAMGSLRPLPYAWRKQSSTPARPARPAREACSCRQSVSMRHPAARGADRWSSDRGRQGRLPMAPKCRKILHLLPCLALPCLALKINGLRCMACSLLLF